MCNSVQTLQVRLQDMAFAVDMSSEALVGGATLAEIWEQNSIDAKSNPARALGASLWQRARTDGAWTPEDRRKYGVADDVYAAGLLVAFMAFVPFCEPDSIDGPTLQVLPCDRVPAHNMACFYLLCLAIPCLWVAQVPLPCSCGSAIHQLSDVVLSLHACDTPSGRTAPDRDHLSA